MSHSKSDLRLNWPCSFLTSLILLETLSLLFFRSEKCGETRNCLTYNSEKLRTSVVGFMFGWIVVTLVLDVMTWYYAKDLKLYDDEEDGGEDGKDKDSKDRDSGFQVN